VLPTLILFAGMPGSGKTTLCRLLAQELRIPVFSKDRVQLVLRQRDLVKENTGDGYYVILSQAEEHLGLGMSAILDATFPLDHLRLVASDIARRWGARFKAVYCSCSDDRVWRERMEQRSRAADPDWNMATWADVQRMRAYYKPWGDNALEIDSLKPPNENFLRALAYIQDGDSRYYMAQHPEVLSAEKEE
jgi:predicted kinase